MEEDIKILEEMIKANEFILSTGDGTHPIDVELTKRNNALKHLIARNEEFTKIIDKEDYIPKSKIKEKIEEIEESMNKARPFDLSYIEYCEDRIEVLQELLGDE